MHLSRHSIVAPIPGSEKTLLVQPLSGEVALLEGEESRVVRELAPGAPLPPSLPIDELRRGKFAVDSDDDERALVTEAYAAYLAELDQTETQLVVVPTFGCT
jgi:hypothetical protein